jgi:filamentous hemagglutinin
MASLTTTQLRKEHHMENQATNHPPRSRRLVAWITLIVYIGQPLAVTAQVVADQGAAPQYRPAIGTTANGVELVQIAAPSAGGVSRNQYTQFNVDPRGLILNNSQTLVQTQLGGYVAGNANLSNGTARIILNEVTGTGQSQLRGYTEVAGQRAEVIIANPNGITCDGCGFINTSRGVLTTGTPVMGGSGSLDAFRVTGGQIQIGAGGLNGSNTDQIDLIARSVKVNGELWANNLNVIAGANQVNYADLGVQLIQGDANKPTVGIDVALLGGMYANKIRLIGTEAGVGVNSLGTLAAQAGDFTLDTQGRVTLAGNTSATANIVIKGAEGVTNSGTVYGKQNVQVSSLGNIRNSGMLTAQGNLALDGANISSTGVLGAGIDANGAATKNGALDLAASGRIDATGQNIAGGNIGMTAAFINLAASQTRSGGSTRLIATAGDIDLASGDIQSAGLVTLDSSGNIKNDLGTISGAQIDSNSASLSNRGGHIVQTGNANTLIRTTGLMDNTGGLIESNGKNLTIQSGSFGNNQGKISHAGNGLLSVTAAALNNTGGDIVSNGRASITAASLDNRNGTLSFAGRTDINVSGAISNIGGNIESGAALNVAGANLDNSAGRLVSLNGDGLGLNVAGLLTNSAGATAKGMQGGLIGGNGDVIVNAGDITNSGDISALNNLNVHAAALDNSNGKLASGGALTVAAGATLKNTGGVIDSGTLATLSAATLDNTTGTIIANQLGLTASDLTNQGGSIAQSGTGATTLDILGLLDNTGGTIQTNSASLTLTPQTLKNDRGIIAHAGQGTLTIRTGALTNDNGTIGTNGQADINAASMSNRSGKLTAQQRATLALQGNLDNSAGGYIGADSLAITANGAIDNTSGIIEAVNGFALNGQSLTNTGGIIQNLGTAALDIILTQGLVNSALNGTGGFIGGNGNVGIAAASIDNTGGTLYGKGNLTLRSGGALTNRNGRIQTDANLDAIIAATLDNTGGVIGVNGQAGINAARIVNRGGNLTAQQRATLTLQGNLDNSAGGYIGSDSLAITANGAIDNTRGIIEAVNGFALNGQSLTNTGGIIQNLGTAALDIILTQGLVNSALNGTGGFIGGNGTVGIAAGSLTNSGTLYGKGNLTLRSGGALDNRNGLIQTDATLDAVIAATLDNTTGTIIANQLGLTASDLTNQGGSIAQSGTGATTLDILGLLDNTGGTIQTNSASLTLTPQTLKNDRGIIAHAGQGTLTIRTGALTNDNGTIGTNGQADINAASMSNRSGKLTAQQRATLALQGNLDNSAGGYIGADSLAITANGAIDNTSGIIEAVNGFALNGQSLTNTGGIIQNLGTAALDIILTQGLVNSALNGTGGFIGGNGNVGIAAASIDNTGGTLYGKGNLTLRSGGALTNRNGRIQTDANLDAIIAAGLDNNGGGIEANGATSTATVSAASIDNTAGRIVNAGKGLTRIDGPAANSGQATLIKNTGGTIGGNGDVEILAAVLLNSSQGNIQAGNDLALNIANRLDNTNGQLYATGNLTFDQAAATLNNTSGNIGSQKNSVFNLASITNTGGKFVSNGNLNLTARTLNGRGQILANGNATIGLQGNYINAAGNVFAANGDLTLNIAGSFTNQTALEALGKLTVSATGIVNQAGASFNSSQTSLNATGDIVNNGRIDGSRVATTSNNFTNNASVIGDFVSITANNLTNRGDAAIIAATMNIDLWIANLLANQAGAEIYSMGNINIAANSTRNTGGNFTNLTQRILNEGSSFTKSSLIEAGANINIGAVTIDNVRPQITPVDVVRSVTTKRMTPPVDYTASYYQMIMPGASSSILLNTSIPGGLATVATRSMHSGFFSQDIVGLNANAKSFDVVGNDPISGAPKVYYDSISSTPIDGIQYSSMVRFYDPDAGWRTRRVSQIVNTSDIANTTTSTGPYGATHYNVTLKSGAVLVFDRFEKQGQYYDVNYYPGYDPNVNTHPSQLQSSWVMNEQYRDTTTTVTDQVVQTAVPKDAQIRATGNINVNLSGTLTNYISTIAAGGNITISGSTTAAGAVNNAKIDNQGLQLTRSTSTSGSAYLFGYYSCGSGWGAGACGIDLFTPLTPTSVVSALGTSLTGSITAGGSINAHVGVVTNHSAGAGVPMIGSTLGGTQNSASVIGSGTQTAVQNTTVSAPLGNNALTQSQGSSGTGGTGSLPTVNTTNGLTTIAGVLKTTGPALGLGVTQTESVQQAGTTNSVLRVPTSGLYTIHNKPGQHYLVETDARFTNYKNFISSDYMLKSLGVDPQRTQKRLGDGFYEQKLVTDQIAQLTGRRYLGQYASNEEQYKALMESGLAAAKEFHLTPGISLSAEQTAALTADIVWMVEQEITLADGSKERVLVPQLYLGRLHNADLQPGGALIAADDINIQARDTLENAGHIQGGTRTLLTAGDIINRGGTITSTGETRLDATRDILNQSGNIGGQRVALIAGRDILNTTLTSTYRVGDSNLPESPRIGLGASNTLIGATGTISATGNLTLDAARNLTVAGADVRAGGNAVLHAGGNLALGTITAETKGKASTGYSHFDAEQTTHLGSTIQTTGDLTLTSGKNMTLTSATLDVGKSATLLAGGDLGIGAATDTGHLDADAIGSGFYGVARRYDENTRGSTIQTTGDLTIATGAGAQTGKHNLTLEAATITSKTGAINLSATGDIGLQAVHEQHTAYDYEHTESNDLLSSSATTTRAESSRNDAIGNSLSGNKVNLRSGRDITVEGSTIAGTEDVSLTATNDITIKAATSTYSQSTYKHTEESGLLTGDGMGFTIGSREQTDRSNADGTIQGQNRSLVGSTNGNLTLIAGNTAHVSGSDIVAANDLTVVAENITFDTGLDHNTAGESHDFSQSGLTLALNSPVISAIQTVGQMTQAAGKTKDARTQALAGMTAGLAVKNAYDAVSSASSGSGGGLSISLTVGSSQSHSESTQTSDQHTGSSAVAGHNLTLIATRATGADDQTGNITVIGSDIRAGNDASLEADNRIDLLAAQNTASQTSKNSSSSAGVGIAATMGSNGWAIGFTANASVGRGHADGSDTTYTNSHIDAGNTLTLTSGGDTNLIGATATGKKVTADIGGDLNIQSLQDTSTYTSSSQNIGGSVTVGFGFSGSANYSQSNIDSNYASVTEQSGIKAGDNGYQVNVTGNTDLKGSVIAASDKAIADNKTDFKTGGTLTMSDIQNSASYQADAIGFSAGVGSQLGASGGTGSDSGNAQSVTTSGIGVSTGTDTTNSIAKIFDANKVTAEVNAQVQITQAFSQVAPKAVGDYASGKLNEAIALHQQADKETDPAKRDALNQQADALNEAWKEGGSARVALHTAVGALGGGLEGALGAGTTAITAPIIADQINQLDVPPEVKQALILAVGAAIGGAAGGTAGAATGLSLVGNNYLKHAEVDALLKTLKECGNDQACKNKAITDATALSQKNDAELKSECAANPTSPACQGHVQDALNYAGDQQETQGIAETMGSDITRSRTVVLDQTLNGGSYSAVNGIEIRADFFGAMGEQTGAPWFKTAEDVSRNDLQGWKITSGDWKYPLGNAYNLGDVTAWRDAAGNQIMKNGYENFRSIYNDPNQNLYRWSVNQLVHEQTDPKLQDIHQKYIQNFNWPTKSVMEYFGKVNDILNTQDRISAGCLRMGYASNCGSAQ